MREIGVSYEASTTAEKQERYARQTDHEMNDICFINRLTISLVSYSKTLGKLLGLVFAHDPKTLHVSIKRITGYTKRTGGASSVAFAAPERLQNQGFHHLIRHVVKRAFLQRKTGHVRPVRRTSFTGGERQA
jgi:hypothetical protein